MKKIPTKYHVNVLRNITKKKGDAYVSETYEVGREGIASMMHDDREHRLFMLIVLKQKSDTRN